MDILISKKYRSKHGRKLTATVIFLGQTHVVFTTAEYGIVVEHSNLIKSFKSNYEEIPPWKPEVGKVAYCGHIVYGNVTILSLYGESAWVIVEEERIPFTCKLTELLEPYENK